MKSDSLKTGPYYTAKKIYSRARQLSFIAAIFVFLLFLLAAYRPGLAGQPDDTVLNSRLIKTFTKKEHQEWNYIKNHQMGIAGRDLLGHTIFCPPGEKTVLKIDAWFPLSGRKETLCGRLDHFNLYMMPWFISQEADWNNYIVPDQAHGWLIDQLKYVLEKSGRDLSEEWHTCGDYSCMEAEVTPDKYFRSSVRNFWFPSYFDESPLEGMDICTYGAWVGDSWHQWRPEIHPSEMLWWNAGADGRVIIPPNADLIEYVKSHDLTISYLMVVMDDSDRFSTDSDFDFDCGKKPGWRPWASVDHDFQFRYAFSARITPGLQIEPQNISIYVLDSQNIINGYGTTADVPAYNLIIDGKKILSVHNQGTTNRKLGIGFDIRRNSTGDFVEGYLTVTGRAAAESHLVMMLLDESGESHFEFSGDIPEFRPVTMQPVMKAAFLDDECMRFDGRIGLRLDCFRLDPENFQDATAARIWLRKKDAVNDRRELDFAVMGAEDNWWLQVNGPVPLFDESVLDVELTDDSTVEVNIPRIALTATVSQDSPVHTTALAASVWPELVAATGWTKDVKLPTGSLEAVESWEFGISPMYSPVNNDELMREDESVIAEKLTEAISEENDPELERLFGSTTPVSIRWNFNATEAATGEPVEVRVVDYLPFSPDPSAILVALADGAMAGSLVRVMFPQGVNTTVFKLEADATLNDTLGNEAHLTHKIFSHMVTSASTMELADAIMPSLASLAGMPEADFARISDLNSETDSDGYVGLWVTDPLSASARFARIRAMQNASDLRYTIDELALLFASAESCATPPVADEDGDGIPDFSDLCPEQDDRFLDAECNDKSLTLDPQFNINVPCFDLAGNRFSFRFVYAGGVVWAVDLESIAPATGAECVTLNDDFSIQMPYFLLDGVHFSVKFNYLGDIFWEVDLDSIRVY